MTGEQKARYAAHAAQRAARVAEAIADGAAVMTPRDRSTLVAVFPGGGVSLLRFPHGGGPLAWEPMQPAVAS